MTASESHFPSPPTRIVVLPPELVDKIIDHLATDRNSLRICCLIARSWVPRSRFNLFCAMNIPISRLRRFIQRCEAFLPALRRLTFRQPLGEKWDSVTALLLEKAQTGAFKSITCLHIHGMRFPTFTHLTEFLSRFPALRSLYLRGVKCGTACLEYPCPAPFPQLQHISISSGVANEMINWLSICKLPALSNVAFVDFWTKEKPREDRERLVGFLGKFPLQHVEIGPLHLPREDIDLLFAPLNLALHGIVYSTQFGDCTILRPPCATSLFQHWGPFNIYVYDTTMFCHVTTPDCNCSYTEYDWAGLDRLLSHPRFTSISRLTISTRMHYDPAHLLQMMPVVAARGMLLEFSNIRITH
ncbi:hypothetical protein C8J57DRAFT_1515151 [Mycena rebaudengoi]|nr:hypothetical protein C8J57DRAFT_1515151 [Mycena rebaudengoi]